MVESLRGNRVGIGNQIQFDEVSAAVTHLKSALNILERTDVQIAACYVDLAISLCSNEVAHDNSDKAD